MTGGSDLALARSCERGVVAELAWVRSDGGVGAAPVVPLVSDAGAVPALALPYAQAWLARELAGSVAVTLVLSDGRMARQGWAPLAATGRVEVAEDRTGERFVAELLEQELRKHPPSRLLVDSPLLRREHWWYLPRWIVRLATVERVRPVAQRRHAGEAVLAYAAAGSIDADTVSVAGGGDPLILTSLAGRDLAAVPEADAALLTHDFSVPDLERWASTVTAGRLSGARLRVRERSGDADIGAPLGLLARLRRQRRLERDCRRALRSRTLPNTGRPPYGS